MPVCKFFLNGGCKFGDRCRFDHPGGGAMKNQPGGRGNGGNSGRNGPQGNQFAGPPAHGNRFGSLDSRVEVPNGPRGGNARFGGGNQYNQQQQQQNSNDSRNQRGRGFQGNQGNQGNRGANQRNAPQRSNVNLNLTEQDIIIELNERPEWPMSCFGPGKNPPVNLWGGDIEQSPEEVRTAHYLAVANGTPEQTPILEADMINAANSFVQNALRDPRGAIDYIEDGQQQHPNRYDELKHERSKHPNFCVDNFHKRRGVFSHIPLDDPRDPRSNGAQNRRDTQQPNGGFAQSSSTGFNRQQQNGFNQSHGNAFSGQPSGSGFGQPQFGAPSIAAPTQLSGGFAQPQFGAPHSLNGFGQPNPQDTQMGGPMSPMNGGFTQSPSGFGQQSGVQPNNAFGQQAQPGHFGAIPSPQSNTVFATQGPTQSTFGASGFGTAPQAAPFGSQQPQQPQAGMAPTSINQQPQHGTISQPQTHVNGSGVQGHPVPGKEHLWVDDDLHRLYAAALENGGFPDGMIPTAPPPAYFVQ